MSTSFFCGQIYKGSKVNLGRSRPNAYDIFINDIVTIKENILVNAIYYDNRTDPRFMLHVIDKDNGNILKRWMNVNDFNCNWNELVSRQGGFFYSKGQTPIKYTNFFRG